MRPLTDPQAVGDTVRIDFIVSDVDDIFGAGLDFSYNPLQLRYLSATEGPFLNANHQIKTIFVATNDSLRGSVIAGITRSNYLDGGANTSGDTLLLSLTFVIKLADTIPLIISQSSLIASDGVTKYPHTVINGILLPDSPTDVEDRFTPDDMSIWVGSPYPNPCNGTVQLAVTVGAPENVEITLVNMLGQVIRRLAKGRINSGTHTYIWDGCDEQGTVTPSGIYLVHVGTRQGSFTRKIVFLK